MREKLEALAQWYNDKYERKLHMYDDSGAAYCQGVRDGILLAIDLLDDNDKKSV